MKNLRQMDCPMVLHTATIKGKGYAFAEADPTLYHGVSPFNPKVGIIKSGKPSAPTYTQIFSRWVNSMAARDHRLYAITPAMREALVSLNLRKTFRTAIAMWPLPSSMPSLMLPVWHAAV